MALPVRLHPKALEEGEAAVSWYRERSELVAVSFLDELDLAISQLANKPSIYPLFEGVTRRILLARFPYMLIFREERHGWK